MEDYRSDNFELKEALIIENSKSLASSNKLAFIVYHYESYIEYDKYFSKFIFSVT